MSIFKQLAAADSTQGRLPFISCGGVSLDRVIKIRTGETQDSDPFFAIDLECVEVISEMPLGSKVTAYNESQPMADKRVREGAHQPGERYTAYVKMAKPFLETKIGNVKNMVVAVCDALGIDDYDEWSGEQWDSAITDNEDGLAAGDGTLAAGVLLVRSSEPRVNKNRDGAYIVSTFSANDEQPALAESSEE